VRQAAPSTEMRLNSAGFKSDCPPALGILSARLLTRILRPYTHLRIELPLEGNPAAICLNPGRAAPRAQDL
jgi:hypothetical protein